MNKKLGRWKAELPGREICVLGIGISHLPLIEYLVKNGAKVTACDMKSEEALGETAGHLKALGVTLKLGPGYLSNLSGDLIFKTPGLRPDVPALSGARKRGIPVTTEMEEFLKLCPAPVTAVTGSDGKTTTTTLIYTLLSMAGYKTHVGGNIGTPLLPKIDEILPEDQVVLELSSFQLQTMTISPQTAVVTNITPNHLDYHTDYQEYIDAKKNIYLHQKAEDILIGNRDFEITRAMTTEAKGRALTFSSREEAEVCLKDGVIYYRDEPVLCVRDIKIPGAHNVENYMAAIAAVYPKVSAETIQKCARTFGGVPHRIEFVRELAGVRYYNSSIDSSPNRSIHSLKVFSQPVVMIAGGKDKGIPYDALGPAIREHVKALVLIGPTAKVISEVAAKAAPEVPVYFEESYEATVNRAAALAKSGDVVLLSSASTSFDRFKNFEERGNLFKELVNKL